MSSFGGTYFYVNVYHIAAAYMFYIIKNHAFIDGNKRTGAVVALTFLITNKIQPNFLQDQLVDYSISIATDKLSLEELANVFEKNSIKLSSLSN